MEKYIYKITNQINGKVYIGQTNNLKRRIQEHKHDKRKNKPIHNAIVKYGWENFNVNILYYGEDYNDEEKKWISYYDSRNKNKGYNIVEGGQDSSGEDNPASILKQVQVDQVIDLLLYTQFNTREISKRTGVSLKNINNINSGISWRNNNLNYPLRELVHYLSNKELKEIYDLLQNTNYSYSDIAKLYNIKSYIVNNINLGKTYVLEGFDYPLRDLNKDKKEKVLYIIELLSTTDMYFKDIAKKTNSTISMVSRINLGTSWKQDNIIYPIRNNK